MSISQSLLPEFDHEMATTRRCLERVPDDKFGWKPHEKSMAMGHLASHISEMATWAVAGLKQDALDLSNYKPFVAPTTKELLESFDKNVAEARAAIESTDDASYFTNWSLTSGGKTLLTMPKIAVVRTFVMNHVIHHERADHGNLRHG